MKIIAVIGPESCGKTTLCKQLSSHFSGSMVPEVAREYLENLNRAYTLDDLELIARKQIQAEQEARNSGSEYLFCDTNLLVIKVWAEVSFGISPLWIDDAIAMQKYDVHLLTYPDIPWVADGQREHPHFRMELFDLYQELLNKLNISYQVVQGIGNSRFSNAMKILELTLN